VARPLTDHPAVDRATAAAWCVERSRPVVGLDPLLTDVLETAAGRQVALVTPPSTRITVPLEAALARRPHRWVVRGAPFTDGLTGAPVRWDGAAFADAGPAPAPVPAGDGGALRIDVTALHPADALTDVGGLAEEAAAVLLGGRPTGWGVAEPATQPWARHAATRFCRDRAPRSSTLVVVAGLRAVGLLTVRLTGAGVHERLRLAVGADGAPDRALLDGLAAGLVDRGARSLTAVWHPGPADTTRAPGPAPRPVPRGLLVPPDRLPGAVRADPPFDVAPLGSGAWVRLGPADPHTELARLAAATARAGPPPGPR
jgi:hypothetical protein